MSDEKPCLPCQKAKEFAQNAAKVMTGEVKAVPKDIQAARLAICKTCDQLERFHKGIPESADVGLLDKCKACGCQSIKTKAAFAFECKLGKWAIEAA